MTFLDRNKNLFNCDEDEEEIMSEENMKEQKLAPYPDIQADMPGCIMRENHLLLQRYLNMMKMKKQLVQKRIMILESWRCKIGLMQIQKYNDRILVGDIEQAIEKSTD